MAIEVYLNFNGNCRQAVEFYAQAFNTPVQQMMTFGDSPQDPNFQLPEEAKNLILHTFLMISGSRVMFSDTFPGQPFTVGNNVNVTVLGKNVDELKTYFEKLKVGGNIQMDLQETFWSKCYGMLTDQFGICWQISYDNE
ncbi:MAG: glyoxalase family protein [Haloplasmataceae bacterium]|jgi:PhnB protein|nr:glyoxalase family protein [Haloplasmataceae bacterium]